jgi:DNA-binding CsgD family transcriptional regulator
MSSNMTNLDPKALRALARKIESDKREQDQERVQKRRDDFASRNLEIVALRRSGMPRKEIADKFGLTVGRIATIIDNNNQHEAHIRRVEFWRQQEASEGDRVIKVKTTTYDESE